MKHLKNFLFFFLFIGLIFLIVTIISYNKEPISLTLFNYVSNPIPKWALILITFAFGAIFSAIFFVIDLIVLETKNIRLKMNVSKMEKKVNKLEVSSDSEIKINNPIDTKKLNDS